MSKFDLISAQAELHHQYFLGLQLMVAVEESKDTVYDWMFRLFRRQHEEKFLSSFEKLGLNGQPHAIACAKYHVVSNGIGGVAVEYMESSPRKAWVRFRYPRWMYAGPAICGIPAEAGRGFLRGWYAQNGVSLNNPRLGFVCVSEDVTGQFGLCGYFQEYDHKLTEEQRLVFAPDEAVPAFDSASQPTPPSNHWDTERLEKANRNYAMEYVRNGISALGQVVGQERAQALATRAARLTGLQHYPVMSRAAAAIDGGPRDAGNFICKIMSGMGDHCTMEIEEEKVIIHHTGLRIARGLLGAERENLLNYWSEIWRGAIHSHRTLMQVHCVQSEDKLIWTISHKS